MLWPRSHPLCLSRHGLLPHLWLIPTWDLRPKMPLQRLPLFRHWLVTPVRVSAVYISSPQYLRLLQVFPPYLRDLLHSAPAVVHTHTQSSQVSLSREPSSSYQMSSQAQALLDDMKIRREASISASNSFVSPIPRPRSDASNTYKRRRGQRWLQLQPRSETCCG